MPANAAMAGPRTPTRWPAGGGAGWGSSWLRESSAAAVVHHGPDDPDTRAQRAAETSADLARPPRARPVRQRHLQDPQAAADGLRLHLHVPAVRRVLHAERFERPPAD